MKKKSNDLGYGKVYCNLAHIMHRKKISMYKICKLTGLKYEVISKYYYNKVYRYDCFVLCKLCFILNCDISDILCYISYNKK